MTIAHIYHTFVTVAPSYTEAPDEGKTLLTTYTTSRESRWPCDVLGRRPKRVSSMEGGHGVGSIRYVTRSRRVPMSVPLVHNPPNRLNTSTSSSQSSSLISPQLHTPIPPPLLSEAVVLVPFLAAHPLDTAPIVKHEIRGALALMLGAPTCTPIFHRRLPPTP